MTTATECLEEQQLLELATGEMSGEAARSAHEHLDACAICRRVLALACDPAAGGPHEDEGRLRAGATVDRYVIRDLIGIGGMGVVYAAHDPELDREIALKLVRDDAWASGTRADNQARLIREARTIARLSHPNVIAVHDAGRHDGGVFVAMELITGADLAGWLRERARPWHEMRAVLVAAGRGLAAAHAAGLVHRDVKPANVLVGADGRVRVGDFGLARTATPVIGHGAGERRGVGDREPRVTRTGGVAGTPSYMAPEQFEGTATAASDQYSFCATAYEALYGVRPYPGDTIDAIRARMTRAELEPPVRDDAPAYVRRALVRGLAGDPAARHASMEALLDALVPPVRRRAAVIAVGVALLATVTATWAIARHDAPEACADPTVLLDGIWDEAVAKDLEQSFVATGAAHAQDAWRQTRRTLDAYAADWVDMHREACRATRVRREQSEEIYQRRLACLEQRRTSIQMLTARFAVIESSGLDGAALAAGKLPRLQDCLAPAYLTGIGSTGDPSRARAWQDLELGRALLIVQSYDEAAAALERVLAAAEAIDDQALRAEALILLGRVDVFRSDLAASVRHLSAGVEAAGELGAEGLRVEGWAFLSSSLQRLGRFDEAARLLDLAEAALRATPDPAREIDVAASRGMLHGRRSRYEQAAERFEHVLALTTELYGADSARLTPGLRNLAIALRRLGRLEEALALTRRALKIDLVLGEHSPKVARARAGVGVALSGLGRYDEALVELERAATVLRRAHGEVHLDVASVEDDLGVVLIRRRTPRRAIEHLETALAIRQELAPGAPSMRHTRANLAAALIAAGRDLEAEPILRELLAHDIETHGERHVSVAERQLSLGNALRHLGRLVAARKLYEASRTTFIAIFGEEHWRVADTLVALASLERDRRRFRAALALDRRAQAIWARARPPEHPAHADILALLALDHLGLGSARQAHALIQQAIERRRRDADGPTHGDRWVLARTLWATGEHTRGLELARELRTTMAAITDPDASTREALDEINAWLADKDD